MGGRGRPAMLARTVSPMENTDIARPRHLSNHRLMGTTHHTSRALRKIVRIVRKQTRKLTHPVQVLSASMAPPRPIIAPLRHQRDPARSSSTPSAGPGGSQLPCQW